MGYSAEACSLYALCMHIVLVLLGKINVVTCWLLINNTNIPLPIYYVCQLTSFSVSVESNRLEAGKASAIRTKVSQCMDRAEAIKDHINSQKTSKSPVSLKKIFNKIYIDQTTCGQN